MGVALYRGAYRIRHSLCFTVSLAFCIGSPTELPDSLEDAAEIAALACVKFAEATGPVAKCRVDFDTSAGDETFTILKSSTEFMQKFVGALMYAMIPGLADRKQKEMMTLIQAKAEYKALMDQEDKLTPNEEEEDEEAHKKHALLEIIQNKGRQKESDPWEGPTARIYFPDEGSAALARRDWGDLVPECAVECASCGGVQPKNIAKDELVFFFCPRASESQNVEELLATFETTCSNLKLVVFVNPNLVDMGVTGFGMAGRLLRERLIDKLTNTYYLRTLQWGALTRKWPQSFSVWQEDEGASGGYRLIRTLDQLPSNPQVEDIYDMENGTKDAPQNGVGFLNSLGDFVNGMMKL
jgi:hypothetical protein